MKLNDITKIIVVSAYQIHTATGPGLLESVYEILLADLLESRGLQVSRQVIVPIRVGDRVLSEGFRADIVVNGLIIAEIKSVDRLQPVHKKQVLTYLKLTNLKVGLLINFNGERLKGNIERLVLNAEDRSPHLILPSASPSSVKPLPSSARNSAGFISDGRCGAFRTRVGF